MKIRTIHTYQPVLFEGRQDSYFTTLANVPSKAQVIAKLIEKLGVIEIKSIDSCDPKRFSHVLIPLANCKFIELWTSSADEYEAERKRSLNEQGVTPTQFLPQA